MKLLKFISIIIFLFDLIGNTIIAQENNDPADYELKKEYGNINADVGSEIKRYAIVIGFNYLENRNGLQALSYAESDATEIKERLEKYGNFKVYQFKKKEDVKDKIETLKKSSENSIILFYFSGHGKDSEIIFEDGEKLNIKETFLKSKNMNKKYVLILDACRVGTEYQNSEKQFTLDGEKVKEEKLNRSNLIYLTSSRSGSPSYEDETKKHGIFTFHLLEVLDSFYNYPIFEGTISTNKIYNSLINTFDNKTEGWVFERNFQHPSYEQAGAEEVILTKAYPGTAVASLLFPGVGQFWKSYESYSIVNKCDSCIEFTKGIYFLLSSTALLMQHSAMLKVKQEKDKEQDNNWIYFYLSSVNTSRGLDPNEIFFYMKDEKDQKENNSNTKSLNLKLSFLVIVWGVNVLDAYLSKPGYLFGKGICASRPANNEVTFNFNISQQKANSIQREQYVDMSIVMRF